MHLEKWYLDVFDQDKLNIFYRAKLEFGPLHIGCEARLDQTGMRDISFNLFGRSQLPSLVTNRSGSVVVSLKANGKTGIWSGALSNAVKLWEDGPHHVTWEPLVLNGSVDGLIAGIGYAEKLTMNIAPWHLGIDRLWWGHFCGKQNSLAWIKWEGAHSVQLALHDGARESLNSVSLDRIMVGKSLELFFEGSQKVIDQPIGSGALAGLSLLRHLAPYHFLRGHELKIMAKGVLRRNGVNIDEGYSIRELITWR